ncbi:MAG TPA: hypothetical protein VL221_11875 [Bacteroidota bacterium]|nr:hypothetical protein [Bacteroidota bacterium]
MMKLLACVFLAMLLAAGRSLASLPGGGDSSRSFRAVIDMQVSPHLSSQSSYRDGGYTISLGFGVNVSPALQLGVNIYTGREAIPGGFASPATGWLPLGGASLQVTLFPVTAGEFRPYVALGYGLYSLAAEDGYNGGGGDIEGGMQWDFSKYFSLRGGLQYSIIRYHDPTGEAYQAVGFQPFTLRTIGAALRWSFYPTVLP